MLDLKNWADTRVKGRIQTVVALGNKEEDIQTYYVILRIVRFEVRRFQYGGIWDCEIDCIDVVIQIFVGYGEFKARIRAFTEEMDAGDQVNNLPAPSNMLILSTR